MNEPPEAAEGENPPGGAAQTGEPQPGGAAEPGENPPGGAAEPGDPPDLFCPDEHVLLVDDKNRKHLRQLSAGGVFHFHNGLLKHDDILGRPEGITLRTSKNSRFTAFRPTLNDAILLMKRGAQVIYPKDLGQILMLADVAPGQRLFESGVGSGALSMALLRAGARVLGYEIRNDFARRAVNNVCTYLGEEALRRYEIEERDCYEGIEATGLDRVLLDVPEPWRVVPHAVQALRAGGILLAYTPSIVQAANLRRSLAAGAWGLAETCEVLLRNWHVADEAVRPEHRMVAHTGFVTHARRMTD